MKIFTCTHCENSICTCVIKVNGKPLVCPKGNTHVKWCEVKKTATGDDVAKEGE